MRINLPSREVNFSFMCLIEAITPNLFKEGLPKSKLYAETALTTIYLMLIVWAEVPFERVVLSSTCPHTSTWSSAKPYKQPSYGLNWSGNNHKLLNVTQNITSVELPWSMRIRCTFLPTVTTDITTGSSSCGTTSSKSELVKQREISIFPLPLEYSVVPCKSFRTLAQMPNLPVLFPWMRSS